MPEAERNAARDVPHDAAHDVAHDAAYGAAHDVPSCASNLTCSLLLSAFLAQSVRTLAEREGWRL